jgi:2-polyprenyl-6-methoxyphenol hydroxylase-like FAD-dependent oxidoreductase
MGTVGDTALVIGGGFAGMLAARVLADFFRHVIVCEKDLLADDALPRRGVPQGPHIHGPLLGTIHILSELFPGLPAELAARGASMINNGIGTRTFARGRWVPQRDFGLHFPMQTRGLLEHVICKLLSAIRNVSTRPGCRVLGLLHRNDRITGVIVRDIGGADETIVGDLVVDASGRGSRVRRWLADFGYGEPHVSQINVDVRYVSCLVRIPPGYPEARIGLRIRDGSRTGACFPVEDNQWIVSLSGRFGDYPPTEAGGFIQYADAISPEIARRVRAGEMSKLASYYFPSNLHWHYEAMPLFPHRFLPIGDTVMCLNPVYGQGMATAGFQAKTLAAELAARRTSSLDLDGFAGNVLRRNVDVLEYPWRTAALGDFELDQTTGDRPAGLTESARFAEALAALAVNDAEVHRVSLRVQQLLDAPDAIVRSGIRDRVLAHLASHAG